MNKHAMVFSNAIKSAIQEMGDTPFTRSDILEIAKKSASKITAIQVDKALHYRVTSRILSKLPEGKYQSRVAKKKASEKDLIPKVKDTETGLKFDTQLAINAAIKEMDEDVLYDYNHLIGLVQNQYNCKASDKEIINRLNKKVEQGELTTDDYGNFYCKPSAETLKEMQKQLPKDPVVEEKRGRGKKNPELSKAIDALLAYLNPGEKYAKSFFREALPNYSDLQIIQALYYRKKKGVLGKDGKNYWVVLSKEKSKASSNSSPLAIKPDQSIAQFTTAQEEMSMAFEEMLNRDFTLSQFIACVREWNDAAEANLQQCKEFLDEKVLSNELSIKKTTASGAHVYFVAKSMPKVEKVSSSENSKERPQKQALVPVEENRDAVYDRYTQNLDYINRVATMLSYKAVEDLRSVVEQFIINLGK